MQNVTRIDHLENHIVTAVKTQRPGWHTVTPRIVVAQPQALLQFMKTVFGAQGEYRPRRPIEVRIGDSILMVSDGDGKRDCMGAFLYVYVDDVDATFNRALEAQATSLEAPAEMPYGDRRAMLRDPWGNLWQIASHNPVTPTTDAAHGPS